MEPRLKELLERMTAPGSFPGISASEGHELVDMVYEMERETEIIKLYEPTSSDGHSSTGDGVYFLDIELARMTSEQKHGNYASSPIMHLGIEIEKDKYLLLKQEKPVLLANSESAISEVKKNAISKLSEEEIDILGLRSLT